MKFTVVTPDGKPAGGSVFETIPSHQTLYNDQYSELFRFKDQINPVLDIAATTDEKGEVQIEYPAFGQSVNYRLRHPTGYARRSLPAEPG